MNLIIKPLFDNYQTISVSVTDLENFDMCAKKYKEVLRVENKSMGFGIKAHEMIIQYLYSKSDEAYNFMTEYFIESSPDSLERKRLSEYLDLAHFNIPKIFLGEKKLALSIECGMYLIDIRMKIDMLHVDGSIGDIKTTDYSRSPGEETYKLQKEIYTLAYRYSRGIETGEKQFIYHILSKHKKDNCKLESRVCNIDLTIAREKLLRVVKEYVVAYHKSMWIPKKNKYCKGCELYKTNMCELRNPILARTQLQHESTNSLGN